MKKLMLLAVLMLPLAGFAQSRGKLVDQYTGFAGSKSNSQSLVDGLRSGSTVTLSDGKTTTTFTPPTGKMGNGNVHIALAIAQEDLKKQGISNPTPAQLQSEMLKILQERASHKGWGEIAKERGFKVGDVMRADKPDQQARADRPDKPEKPERPEHPDRSGRGPR